MWKKFWLPYLFGPTQEKQYKKMILVLILSGFIFCYKVKPIYIRCSSLLINTWLMTISWSQFILPQWNRNTVHCMMHWWGHWEGKEKGKCLNTLTDFSILCQLSSTNSLQKKICGTSTTNITILPFMNATKTISRKKFTWFVEEN